MPKIFEMTRRARFPLRCCWCKETIEPGKRWIMRRVKEGGSWQTYCICEECSVFGPEGNPWAFGPFVD